MHMLPESHLPESLNVSLQGALLVSNSYNMMAGPRWCLYDSFMSVAMK